jgi:hypothetical protein
VKHRNDLDELGHMPVRTESSENSRVVSIPAQGKRSMPIKIKLSFAPQDKTGSEILDTQILKIVFGN